MNKKELIIGIDHGYGFTKTANFAILSGAREVVVLPPFKDDILTYKGKIWVVGQERMNHAADKTGTQEFYILTLAAIAQELELRGRQTADNVIIAAGLPYSFYQEQKDSFKKYLLSQRNIEFNFERKSYKIHINDVIIFPQGFPVIAGSLNKYKKGVSVVDIGSRTIDVITFNGSGRAVYDKCFSIDKKGVLDCMESVQKNYLSKYQKKISEEAILEILRGKQVSIGSGQLKLVKTLIGMYVTDILRLLDANGIDNTMNTILFCGGGANVIERYMPKSYQELKNVAYVTDIHANAKGYERLAKTMKQGGKEIGR